MTISEIPQEVIDGIEFLFDVAETVDTIAYASKEDQAKLKAAGDWLARVKRLRGEKAPKG